MRDYMQNKRPKDPNVYKLIRKTITLGKKEIGLDLRDVAEELGIDVGTFENKLKPSSIYDVTITELIHFLELTDNYEVLEYIASLFDFVLVHKHQSHSEITNINILTDCTSMESADVFRVVKTAVSDGIITKDEKKSILKEIEDADRANAELRDYVLNLTLKD